MKRLFWIGSSRDDLKQFPNEVQDEMGATPKQEIDLVKHRLKEADALYKELKPLIAPLIRRQTLQIDYRFFRL